MAAALICGALAACKPGLGRSSLPPPPDAPPAVDEKDQASVADTPEGDACGPEGERFDNLDWVPADARFVAAIDLSTPDDTLAEALAQLSALEDEPAAALPVFVAFEFDGLSIGATTVRALLDDVGLRPDELVKLTSPSGLPVWILPSSCDVGELSARVSDRWQMSVRETAEGRVGTTSADADAPLPFDLLVLPGDRLALTPREKHLDARSWLARPVRPTGASSLDTGPGAPPIGALVYELEPASIRAAYQGRSLLTPGSAIAETTDPSRPRTLRVSAEDVWIDGSLRSR